MSYITTILVLVVLSVLCALAQGCTDNWDHIIYVDHTATDTPTCGNITHCCSTFNTALNKLTHNSTAICLFPGTYDLTNGSHTQLLYKSNIAIIGSSEDTVTVQCSPLSGLSFYRSSNITLKSLTLRKCGSEKFSISRLLGMVRFQVSVYMLYCENVLIDTVTIESSNGTGLTLYNTVGTVTIQYCVFKYNGVSLDKSSAGGLQIEFTYCTPEVAIHRNCKESDPYYSSNAQYNITSSVFTGNIATYMYALSSDINVLLGRGGGVSITLEGHAFNNVFNLLDTNITNNTAQQGGGIYLSLHDGAQNSNIIFNNINILNNIANANIDEVVGGGAILIELRGFFTFANNISISKTIIEHNEAIVGGGILLLADSNFLDKNSIVISNSTFHHNSAQHGAAMYLYSFIDPLALYVLISDTNFAKNVVEKISSLLACSGIICTDLSFTFTGTIMLTSNNGSAIELHWHASLVLDNNSYCIFDGNINTGDRGGAVALYDCSTIVLHDNVQLVFNNNSADIGGAIYSGECSLPVCFIQYHQAHVNPEEWNVQLYFSDNTAATYGNAMYISNVVSCWPPNVTCSSITENVEIINQTFCWNNTWHYSPGDCHSNVNTSILYYTSPSSLSVYPGGELRLGLEFYDGQMQASNELLKLCTNGPAYIFYRNCKEIKSNDVFNIYFNRDYDYSCIDNQTEIYFNINFSSVAPCNGSSGTVIDFTFESCPSGANGPFCSSHMEIEPYYYRYYPRQCPDFDCPQDLIPVDSTSCLKGSGISSEYALCVGCNYTNYKCFADRDDTHVEWHIIILVEFIPLTIMMLSIIVLDIKLVGGHITGYILYCQIVSLPFAAAFNPGRHYTEPLMSLWNLNFVNPFMSFKFCISNHVSGLEVILFWYIVAFYPLVLLLLLYIWIIMYERGWRMVVCITRPVHRLLARFWLKFDIHPSLIDSIAGIYILCFTQLAATSFKILHSLT